MAALAALICFIFACFKFDPFGKIDMLPLGLAFVALHLLIGNWPFGAFNFNRNNG